MDEGFSIALSGSVGRRGVSWILAGTGFGPRLGIPLIGPLADGGQQNCWRVAASSAPQMPVPNTTGSNTTRADAAKRGWLD